MVDGTAGRRARRPSTRRLTAGLIRPAARPPPATFARPLIRARTPPAHDPIGVFEVSRPLRQRRLAQAHRAVLRLRHDDRRPDRPHPGRAGRVRPRRPTAIVFTADHGKFTGAHQLNDKGPAMYDIYRIPALVSVSGAEPQGLGPVQYPSRLHRDRPRSRLAGAGGAVRRPELSVSELYDLVADPHALHNVYEEPEYRAARRGTHHAPLRGAAITRRRLLQVDPTQGLVPSRRPTENTAAERRNPTPNTT